MTKRSTQNSKKQRGIALLSVIALLIVFLIFAGAVMTQLAQEVNSSKTNGVSVKALSAADAGVHAMILAIEENISLGKPDPATFTYQYPEPGASPSTTSYTVSIDNKYLLLPQGGSRYYVITSKGQVANGIENQTRTVRAIARAVSIAQYASFSNYESNQFGKTVWYTPDQYFNGQVYSGGPMHVEYDNTHWDYSKFLPIFGDTVQTVNNPAWLELQGGVPPVDDGNDWASVIDGGQPNFATGVTPIGLPQPTEDVLVASEAYYGTCCSITSSYPSVSDGVYMNQGDAAKGSGPLTTGIYVSGNATISSATAGSVNTFTIKGATFPTYTVAITLPSGPTVVTQGGNVATYSGAPSGPGAPGSGNGALFVNGDATMKLGSVIHGQYTLAVPDYAGDKHNIFLTGNGSITYSDKAQDELGLWANNIVVNTNSSNIEVDASLIAGFPGEGGTNGGFYNAKCNGGGCSGGDQGTLTIFGGLAENMRGALGKFFPGPPVTHTGFDRHITYDQRLASDPPPFNPVTGTYDIIAWEDLGS